MPACGLLAAFTIRKAKNTIKVKAIARKLFVEKTTIKTHIRRIAEKFNVENTIEALFRYIDDVNRQG
ncbi:hypothetical protein CULT_40099 [[Clostridium] ultunense Esp]|nr:hypothetical protein CULT_40099 [[Clostridium] ultunense Esp]